MKAEKEFELELLVELTERFSAMLLRSARLWAHARP